MVLVKKFLLLSHPNVMIAWKEIQMSHHCHFSASDCLQLIKPYLGLYE